MNTKAAKTLHQCPGNLLEARHGDDAMEPYSRQSSSPDVFGIIMTGTITGAMHTHTTVSSEEGLMNMHFETFIGTAYKYLSD